MASKNKAVFGIYPDRLAVEEAVTPFLRAGFRTTDVSALFPENPGSKDFGHEKNCKAPEGAAAGAIVGGIVGGVLAWVIAMGYIYIPALGVLTTAGPLLSALAGFGAGAVLGLIIGALIGLAIPEYEARRYAGRTRHGGVLASVHCDNSDWTGRAKAILNETGAQGVGVCDEKAGDFANADKPMPRVRTTSTHPDPLAPVAPPAVTALEEPPQPVTTAPEHKPFRSLSS